MLALRELGGDVPVSLGLPITYIGTNLERGLQIAESLGDRASEADLLCRLAVVAANRLDYTRALDYGRRGLAAGRASGHEQAVAAGAQVTMPLADQFWGDRYGQLRDPFGHKWSVGQTLRTPNQEELEEGAKAAFSA